ncbi:sulfotransferase 1C2-like [Notechis scutatus]|uniref:Sulfotransferase n=1 Tax=Notechis scutatus TaxID=8663 RepID=A0A6J1V0F3_9SAUR|nr:sulfotransferase 1C2-like [Notechis scutatus]
MELPSSLEDLDPKFVTRCSLIEIEGVSLPTTTAKYWDRIKSFQARPDDLLICSYPKAGSTWLQETVNMIQNADNLQKCAQAPIYKRMPFLDMFPPITFPSDLDNAEARPSPRSLKSHLPVHLLAPSFWEQKCKVIYIARNAKDTVVSYFHFHHMNKTLPHPGNWEEFLDKFLAGKVICGSWFDHVCGWWEAKKRHPILYLFYEDMKEDPIREMRKIAQFLGLELQEPVLNQILEHTQFETMKGNKMANYSTVSPCLMDHTVSPFLKKGIVGDWKEHFTVSQSEHLDGICSQLLEGSGLTFRTEL